MRTPANPMPTITCDKCKAVIDPKALCVLFHDNAAHDYCRKCAVEIIPTLK